LREQAHLHRTLAARQYETVFGLLPVAQLAYLKGFGSKLLQPTLVFDECPLQG
jgi:hypothetical protein